MIALLMRRVVVSLSLMLAACGPGSETRDGRELYMAYGCAACHGAAGDGNGPSAGLSHTKPRDLRNVASFSGPKSDEGIASTIAFGVAGGRTGMPPYPDIPKSERLAMARYILSLADAPRGVSATEGRVRASNPARKITGAYMELRNHDSVARNLVRANTPLAAVTEIHEMKTVDGMMSMTRVDTVGIPPGGTLSLEPGGFHLMLIDLARDLKPGDVVPMTLQFDDGSTISLELPVTDAN